MRTSFKSIQLHQLLALTVITSSSSAFAQNATAPPPLVLAPPAAAAPLAAPTPRAAKAAPVAAKPAAKSETNAPQEKPEAKPEEKKEEKPLVMIWDGVGVDPSNPSQPPSGWKASLTPQSRPGAWELQITYPKKKFSWSETQSRGVVLSSARKTDDVYAQSGGAVDALVIWVTATADGEAGKALETGDAIILRIQDPSGKLDRPPLGHEVFGSFGYTGYNEGPYDLSAPQVNIDAGATFRFPFKEHYAADLDLGFTLLPTSVSPNALALTRFYRVGARGARWLPVTWLQRRWKVGGGLALWGMMVPESLYGISAARGLQLSIDSLPAAFAAGSRRYNFKFTGFGSGIEVSASGDQALDAVGKRWLGVEARFFTFENTTDGNDSSMISILLNYKFGVF